MATGNVDASVHLYGGPWDHAPGVVLVEEAGGAFCDLHGGRSLHTGGALFTNAALARPLRSTLARIATDSEP